MGVLCCVSRPNYL
ncbi:hypothetical protein HF086_005781 [Spodoptera exigua]|nr:hypothetical protein HF086_005781 [Spodoptera exigua]